MASRGEQPSEWVLLSYKLPREPSTPRIAIWRKLKRLGVAQLGDGLVALPADARTREHLEWIGDDIHAANGTAVVWIARPATLAQERDVAQSLADARADEYRALRRSAITAGASTQPGTPARTRTLRTLRAELRRIERRDYFPPSEREQTRNAINALAAETTAEETA